MALELWTCGDGGHWFIDTDLGDLMVGQTEQMSDGTWWLENDEWLEAPDLDAVVERLNYAEKQRRREVP